MVPPDDKTVRKDVEDLVANAGALKANFVVMAGQDIGKKYDLSKTVLLIGRGETCEIHIEDEGVSRQHAQIEVREGGIFIKDLGSTNGTLVNGVKIKDHQLMDGDRLQFGDTTILKFNFTDDLEDTFTEQLYNAANKDFLTQVYNKKYFMDRFRSEVSYAKRHDTPLSLLIFDVDHFKRFNDNFGHAAGDLILRDLAMRLSSIKREEDLLARFGGEEFVLLLRDTTQDKAVQIAEKLRSRVEELEIAWDDEKLTITISVGLATMEKNNYRTYQDLFRAADEQMYVAKRSGRNQVRFDDQLKLEMVPPSES